MRKVHLFSATHEQERSGWADKTMELGRRKGNRLPRTTNLLGCCRLAMILTPMNSVGLSPALAWLMDLAGYTNVSHFVVTAAERPGQQSQDNYYLLCSAFSESLVAAVQDCIKSRINQDAFWMQHDASLNLRLTWTPGILSPQSSPTQQPCIQFANSVRNLFKNSLYLKRQFGVHKVSG